MEEGLPLLYVLHSGNLYGTERMALATAEGLRPGFRPTIFAPAGPALELAGRNGMATRAFAGPLELARQLRPFLAQHRQLALVATGIAQSLVFIGLNALYRRRCCHLHVVHGGASEKLSYGRKRLLQPFAVHYVAVSAFVKERLVANGVAAERIGVIENFLPEAQVAAAPQRAPGWPDGIRRVLVVSRVDPLKRVDLLLEALDQEPALAGLRVKVLGTGWELEKLRQRAAESHPNVAFAGFSAEVAREMAQADLLLHLCPSEPFGLAILEAMAAGLPVLVPDAGGAGSLVEQGVSGFRFRADDAADLASRLMALSQTGSGELERVSAGARRVLETRFSPSERVGDYRRLLQEALR